MQPTPSICSLAGELVGAHRFEEAFRVLTSDRAATDPEALYVLANWRLAGRIVRRDLAAARDLFRRAGEAGHDEAARVHIAFVGNGTGGAADWPEALRLLRRRAEHDTAARRQIELIDRMALDPSGGPLRVPDAEVLSERPWVQAIREFFTAKECDFLIAEARPWLEPSVVVDPATGRQVRNPVRTSDAMSFTLVAENPAIRAFNRRIATATGTDPAQGESLQVLRYREREEYRPHFDAVAGETNQRILTALVYLSEDYEGGDTLFTSTGFGFRGRRGDALIFRNVLPDGRPDATAQHAGLPVTRGEKIIASRWIRARPFAVPPPRPLLDV